MRYPQDKMSYGMQSGSWPFAWLEPGDFMVVKVAKRGIGAIERTAQRRGKDLGMKLRVEQGSEGFAFIFREHVLDEVMS